MPNYIPTGNEMISLPKINESSGAIEDFTFLHMGHKGLIDVRGNATVPLIQPSLHVNGVKTQCTSFLWNRLDFWIPTFSCRTENLAIEGIILTPIQERGFIVRLTVCNTSSLSHLVSCGLSGTWASTWHCVNEDKEIEGHVHCFRSDWNDNLIFDLRCGTPLFAFAPIMDKPCDSHFQIENQQISYELLHSCNLAPGESCTVTTYWGIGFEEVAAATSAKEMLRQTFDYELLKTQKWLKKRCVDFQDEHLTKLYNTNLFFCIFYSTGITMDTEELVLATSRSPRYYVSAAYWDRDSFLWSFPAILDADKKLARQMLEYVFGRQRKNLGVHSRFIDGTVLEPGFELDELIAPLLALDSYVVQTKDTSILRHPNVLSGIEEILEKLEEKQHSSIPLYETFLQPTDDERVYPYLTYDNVLVWKALHAIATHYPEYAEQHKNAEALRNAIFQHCIKEINGKTYFAWSVDLEGQYDIYDEPPGSLQLLPYLGFCESSNPTYQNTVAMIRSPQYAYSFSGCEIAEIGCPHAPHPWILSVANSLLCGRVQESISLLSKITMDNMIACESVDEHTGACTTGEAFATCAGFLCHAMRYAILPERSTDNA